MKAETSLAELTTRQKKTEQTKPSHTTVKKECWKSEHNLKPSLTHRRQHCEGAHFSIHPKGMTIDVLIHHMFIKLCHYMSVRVKVCLEIEIVYSRIYSKYENHSKDDHISSGMPFAS